MITLILSTTFAVVFLAAALWCGWQQSQSQYGSDGWVLGALFSAVTSAFFLVTMLVVSWKLDGLP